MPRACLLAELIVLFIVLPLAYRFSPIRLPALPLLWLVASYAWWQLLADAHFNRARLWNAAQLSPHIGSILLTFALIAPCLWLGTHRFAPALEWSFVRSHPLFWALVMLLYPILSVYPQSILYRAFFFERYAALFPGRLPMVFASAAAFAFLHIIFRNWLAVILTFGGGVLFALRYAETASLATSSLEHAIYGCWLFTIGLGGFFYHGTIATVGRALNR